MDNSHGSDPRDFVPVVASPRRSDGGVAPDPIDDAPDGILDFRSVLRVIRRRWKLIALCIALGLAVAVLVRALSPSSYTATARVLLSESQIQPFGREDLFQGISLNSQVIESQMQLIRSPFLISRVVDRMNLSEDPRLIAPATTPLQDTLTDLSTRLGLDDLLMRPEAFEDDPLSNRTAIRAIRQNLQVRRDPNAVVIDIRFTSGSPEFAAEIANAIADTYVNSRILQRQEAAKNASSWFDERIAELETRASQAEARLAALRSGRSDPALSETATDGALTDVQDQLRELISQQVRLRTEISRIEAGLAVGTDDALSALADLVVDPAATDTTGDDGAAPDDLRSALTSRREAAEATLNSIALESNALRDRIAQREVGDATGGTGLARGTELRALESEARIYRTLFENYFESYLRTVQQQSFPGSESLIIQQARTPEVSTGPHLSRLGPVALLLGLVVGLGAAGLREALDGTIRTPGDLGRAIGAPYLGVWPRYDRRMRAMDRRLSKTLDDDTGAVGRRAELDHPPDQEIAFRRNDTELFSVLTRPSDRGAQTMRRVGAHIDQMLHDDVKPVPRHRFVGFVSESPLESRSIVAANYAEMQAGHGKRVLLIDLDWSNQFLTRTISPQAARGLGDLLLDRVDADLGECLWVDDRTSMFFLPNRGVLHRDLPLSAYDLHYQQRVLAKLAARFDEIVIDFSSLSESSDAVALSMSGTVGGLVIVAGFGRTSLTRLTEALQHSQIPQSRIAGGVLSGATEKDLRLYGGYA